MSLWGKADGTHSEQGDGSALCPLCPPSTSLLKVAGTKNEMDTLFCLTKIFLENLNLSLIHSKKLLFSKLLFQCLKDITPIDPFWDHPY